MVIIFFSTFDLSYCLFLYILYVTFHPSTFFLLSLHRKNLQDVCSHPLSILGRNYFYLCKRFAFGIILISFQHSFHCFGLSPSFNTLLLPLARQNFFSLYCSQTQYKRGRELFCIYLSLLSFHCWHLTATASTGTQELSSVFIFSSLLLFVSQEHITLTAERCQDLEKKLKIL